MDPFNGTTLAETVIIKMAAYRCCIAKYAVAMVDKFNCGGNIKEEKAELNKRYAIYQTLLSTINADGTVKANNCADIDALWGYMDHACICCCDGGPYTFTNVANCDCCN